MTKTGKRLKQEKVLLFFWNEIEGTAIFFIWRSKNP